MDGTIDPNGYALGGTTVAQGSLVFNADGSYSFDPGTDFDDLAVGATRDVTFTYTATDNNGAVSAEETITITVTGTNDAPVAVADAVGTTENAILNDKCSGRIRRRWHGRIRTVMPSAVRPWPRVAWSSMRMAPTASILARTSTISPLVQPVT